MFWSEAQKQLLKRSDLVEGRQLRAEIVYQHEEATNPDGLAAFTTKGKKSRKSRTQDRLAELSAEGKISKWRCACAVTRFPGGYLITDGIPKLLHTFRYKPFVSKYL